MYGKPLARLLEKMNSKHERNAEMVWALAELLAISGGCEGCNLRGLHSCQDIVSRKLCWIKKADEMIKYLSEEASGEAGGPGEWFMRTSEEVLQDAYQATEPKE